MFFQKKEKVMLAVADGEAVSLSTVPDEAFSSGILGIGFAIKPSAGTVYCPVSGKIDTVTETRHAYTVLTDDGLDVLIHIGIDTVKLGGEGFLSMVSEGDRIKAGDVIARADLNLIAQKGLDTVIPVVVTNPEKLSQNRFSLGKALGGKSEIMRYRLE